jgi:hypothetical protein
VAYAYKVDRLGEKQAHIAQRETANKERLLDYNISFVPDCKYMHEEGGTDETTLRFKLGID